MMNVCLRTTRTMSQAPRANPAFIEKKFASKKQGGKSKNGRDSNPKYRGFKKNHGQEVIPGNIIIRQKGTKWHPGEGTMMGRDFTVFAVQPGFVALKRETSYLPKQRTTERKIITVVPVTPLKNPEVDIR